MPWKICLSVFICSNQPDTDNPYKVLKQAFGGLQLLPMYLQVMVQNGLEKPFTRFFGTAHAEFAQGLTTSHRLHQLRPRKMQMTVALA